MTWICVRAASWLHSLPEWIRSSVCLSMLKPGNFSPSRKIVVTLRSCLFELLEKLKPAVLVCVDLREDGDLSRRRAALWQRQHTESPLLQPKVLRDVELPIHHTCTQKKAPHHYSVRLIVVLHLSVLGQVERVAHLRHLPVWPPPLSQTLLVYLLGQGKERSQGGEDTGLVE